MTGETLRVHAQLGLHEFAIFLQYLKAVISPNEFEIYDQNHLSPSGRFQGEREEVEEAMNDEILRAFGLRLKSKSVASRL